MKLKWIGFAAATGAALMYMFDPDNGETRRKALFGLISSRSDDVHTAARQASDTLVDVAEAGRRTIAEAERAATAIEDQPPLDTTPDTN